MEFNVQKFYPPPPNIYIPRYLPIATDQTGHLGKSVLVTVLRNSSQSHGVKEPHLATVSNTAGNYNFFPTTKKIHK